MGQQSLLVAACVCCVWDIEHEMIFEDEEGHKVVTVYLPEQAVNIDVKSGREIIDKSQRILGRCWTLRRERPILLCQLYECLSIKVL